MPQPEHYPANCFYGVILYESFQVIVYSVGILSPSPHRMQCQLLEDASFGAERLQRSQFLGDGGCFGFRDYLLLRIDLDRAGCGI
jgi:hypothetical protein